MKVLILNQAFYPDVASTGQHASDLAVKLASSGHAVTAVSSRRAYDKPSQRFAPEETWRGIHIRRLGSSGLGKGALWRRAVDFGTFLGACLLRLATLPRFDVVIAMTSPPLISFLAALFSQVKGGKLVFWVMDLNPDEAIAAGVLREESFTARVLQWMLRYSLRHSSKIIVLDRFMARRIIDKGTPEQKIEVIAPWSHDEAVRYNVSGREAFRRENGLTGKFVVMYSGNHSPCHPLDTLLEAAKRLAGDPDIAFCFAGGGSEFKKVQVFVATHQLKNVVTLPYQPLDKLSASLSSADLHVVVMGDPHLGIVHPCKVYNALSLGIPLLYIGPAPSHITDLIAGENFRERCYSVRHGDADAVVESIREAHRRATPPAGSPDTSSFSQEVLATRMVEVIEAVVPDSRASLATSEAVSR